MECKVSGSPPIAMSWFKDGHEIVHGEKYNLIFGENKCDLKINTLELSDAGNYVCKATNAAGSDECSGTLTVKG